MTEEKRARSRFILVPLALLAAGSVRAQATNDSRALGWCCGLAGEGVENALDATANPPADKPAESTGPKPGRVDVRELPADVSLAASKDAGGHAYTGVLAVVLEKESAADAEEWREAGPAGDLGPMPGGWWVRRGTWIVIWERQDGRRGGE